MPAQLVSEQIKPLLDEVSSRVVAGEPLFPAAFTWRGVKYAVREVIETWKESGPCTHGSGEHYVRKHWYRIRTTGGDQMKIYFERKARSGQQAKQRWWLYTFMPGGGESQFSQRLDGKQPEGHGPRGG